MRKLAGMLTMAAAVIAPACAFLLDFDELQTEERKADAGTDSSTSGDGDGLARCASDCNDNDACTRDFCDDRASPPVCRNEPLGLVQDGVIGVNVSADDIHRITMASGPNAAYLSVFETTNSATEVTLYELGANSQTLESRLVLSRGDGFGGGKPQSAIGMVADTSLGLQLHGYVAMSEPLSLNVAVWHGVLDANFQFVKVDKLSANYDALTKERAPVAARLASGKVWGAWIEKDGKIAGDSAGSGLAFGDAALRRATQLAPIGTAEKPGLLWTVAPAQGGGVYAQITGGIPTALTECSPNVGEYLSATSSFGQLAGLWLTSWTKAGPGFLATEGRPLLCVDNACYGGTDCGAKAVSANIRNLAMTSLTRDGDGPGIGYHASVVPVVAPSDAGVPEAFIVLGVSRLEFGAKPFETPPIETQIGTLELARAPSVGAQQLGPDWPAISVIKPDKLVVAWIEPESNRDQLRVNRYRVCFPR